jgi:hypothetical protein
MNTTLPACAPASATPSPGGASGRGAGLLFSRKPNAPVTWVALLACLSLLLFNTPSTVRADSAPSECMGSGLGINLFTSSPDVHIGDTLKYSVDVFNGLPGSERVVCDATRIIAGIVTPDGQTNMITLVRTTLHQGEGDFYGDVVRYVVRAQDLLPDGTVHATAFIDGTIHQNDTHSWGGRRLGVNTEVRQPCIQVAAVCEGGVGENGVITFNGTVRNCGNAPLENVTVTSQVNGGAVQVLGPITLAIGQSAPFSGSWVPVNASASSTAVFVATGTDNLTIPRTVTAMANCLGSVELSVAPVIRSVNLADGVATVAWDSTAGFTYTLQCKGNAQDPMWIDIPGNVTATGDTASKTDIVGPTTRRFYRVVIVE